MSEPKPRKAAASPRRRPVLVTPQRKLEILGLMLIAAALLVTLALVTYAPDDSMRVLGGMPDAPENAVGRVGAWIAYIVLERGIGRVALVGCGLVFAWGWAMLRQRPKYLLSMATLFLGGASLVVSALAGWFTAPPESETPSPWAGAVGEGVSAWLIDVLGTPGAFIVLLVLLVAVVLVFVERDIQGAVDRVEGTARGAARWGRSLAARLHASREAHLARTADGNDGSDDGAAPAPRRTRAAKDSTDASDGTTKRLSRSRAAAAGDDGRRTADDGGQTTDEAPSTGDPFGVGHGDPFSVRSPAGALPPPPPLSLLLGDDDLPPLPGAPSAPPPVPTVLVPLAPTPEAPPSTPGDGLVMQITQGAEERRVDRLDPLDVPGEEGAPPYATPDVALLDATPEHARAFDPEEIEENKQILVDKLDTYRIKITAVNAIVGPTVTLYELTPAPGIKISRITALEDDLAMAMAATGIRIIAPIPGKGVIGVEIPNRRRQMVRMRDVIATERFKEAKMALPFPIGKSIEGETYVEDLAKMPHVLIAGATGSGKSVGLNTLICGLLYRCPPSHLKFVFIDPKKIELTPYGRLRQHFIAMPENYDEPVVTDFSMALGVLKSCEKEMERRYNLLSKAQVRGIAEYNQKIAAGLLEAERGHRHLPYIVVVVDELADLMMTAGKEIEGPIARLAQMARAIGIHLVLATQRPSVDVITGLIKANFPSRLAYQVASKIDSRTILDQSGAEQLVGNGDLLYMNGSRMVRLQGPYVSSEEIERVTEAIRSQDGPGPYLLPSFEDDADDAIGGVLDETRDELFEDSARAVVRMQQGSVSLLQRKLSIGYGRAARIIDQLEQAGIVGKSEGSKAREVLITTESQLDTIFGKTAYGFHDEDE